MWNGGSIESHGEGEVVTRDEEEHHGLGKEKPKTIISVIENLHYKNLTLFTTQLIYTGFENPN